MKNGEMDEGWKIAVKEELKKDLEEEFAKYKFGSGDEKKRFARDLDVKKRTKNR